MEEPGPTQFYLNLIFDPETGKYEPMNPRDWGRCVSGMNCEADVQRFLDWVCETVYIPPNDREALYTRWLESIGEKPK